MRVSCKLRGSTRPTTAAVIPDGNTHDQGQILDARRPNRSGACHECGNCVRVFTQTPVLSAELIVGKFATIRPEPFVVYCQAVRDTADDFDVSAGVLGVSMIGLSHPRVATSRATRL